MPVKIAKLIEMKQFNDFVFVLLWKDILIIYADEICKFL